jgi:hypothetical protein
LLRWDLLKGGEFRDTAKMKIDDAGLPPVEYSGTFHYNPVTIAQFALTRYSQVQNDAVEKAADKLLRCSAKTAHSLTIFRSTTSD